MAYVKNPALEAWEAKQLAKTNHNRYEFMEYLHAHPKARCLWCRVEFRYNKDGRASLTNQGVYLKRIDQVGCSACVRTNK